MATFAHFAARIAASSGDVWVPVTILPTGAVARFGSKRGLAGFDPLTTIIGSRRMVESAAVNSDYTGRIRQVPDSIVSEHATAWKYDGIGTFADTFADLGICKGRKAEEISKIVSKTLAFYNKG